MLTITRKRSWRCS